MDIVSGLTSSFFWNRLMVNFLPGAVMVAGWVPVTFGLQPTLCTLNEGVSLESAAVVAIVVCIVGVISEEVGALLEVKVFDEIAAKEHKDFREIFMQYLCKDIADVLPAKSFIRNVLIRYKFMLAMIPAFLSLALCVVVLAARVEISVYEAAVAVVACLLLVALFSYQSILSASMLHEVRARHLGAWKEPDESDK